MIMFLESDKGWEWKEKFRQLSIFFLWNLFFVFFFWRLHSCRNCVSILGLSNHHPTLWRVLPMWILLISAGESIPPPPPHTPAQSHVPTKHCISSALERLGSRGHHRGNTWCQFVPQVSPQHLQATGGEAGMATSQQEKQPNKVHFAVGICPFVKSLFCVSFWQTVVLIF